MKRLLMVLAAACFSAGAIADETIGDPETWYRMDYGPLWASEPGENIDQMLGFYANVVETHSADGEVTRSDKNAWLREPMQEWLADGWLSSELRDLEMDRINATTASFKASWLDRYEDSYQELACGWYLADYRHGAWKFTAYADIDCDAHGFSLE